MAADRRILDVGLAQLYARAVLAIARAGGEIEPEEGLRLVERLEARSGRPVSLDDLLLAEPLDPAEIHAELAQRRTSASPFRGADLHPSELAEMIVTDSIAVALAKGYVSEEEARELLRLGGALGCSVDDLRGMSEHLAPFLAALDEAIEFPAPAPAAAANRTQPAKRKPGGAQGT